MFFFLTSEEWHQKQWFLPKSAKTFKTSIQQNTHIKMDAKLHKSGFHIRYDSRNNNRANYDATSYSIRFISWSSCPIWTLHSTYGLFRLRLLRHNKRSFNRTNKYYGTISVFLHGGPTSWLHNTSMFLNWCCSIDNGNL